MPGQNEAALKKLAAHYNLAPAQIELFTRYSNLLEKWAGRTNLVSLNDRQNIVSRHVAESLQIVDLGILNAGAALLDLGSGGGFPGVPLAIVYPHLSVTLLDSRRMKTLFLQQVVEALPLPNAAVLCERAENLPPVAHYDFVTARAVARLVSLWRWSKPLLKETGSLVALKGGNLEEEIAELTARHRVTVQVFPFLPILNSTFSDRKSLVVSHSG